MVYLVWFCHLRGVKERMQCESANLPDGSLRSISLPGTFNPG